MAGGVIASSKGKAYPGKLTGNVLITCLIAATGGLIFCYDLGISGNILKVQPFLFILILLLALPVLIDVLNFYIHIKVEHVHAWYLNGQMYLVHAYYLIYFFRSIYYIVE